MYNLQPQKLIQSFSVFSGIRVHGLSQKPAIFSSHKVVAVYGERKVKLLGVVVVEEGNEISVKMEVFSSLPRFDQWVLDALFLEVKYCFVAFCGDFSSPLVAYKTLFFLGIMFFFVVICRRESILQWVSVTIQWLFGIFLSLQCSSASSLQVQFVGQLFWCLL